MTQTARDPEFRAAFGLRFEELVNKHMGIALSVLASKLGYQTDSALRQVQKGEANLSVEKLSALAALSIEGSGARISVEWLLTGNGPPLIERSMLEKRDPVAARVERATEDTRRVIGHFLDVQEGRRLTDPLPDSKTGPS